MRVCQRLVLLRRRFGVLTVEAQTHRRGVGAGLQPFTLVGSASWGCRPRLVWMRRWRTVLALPPGVVSKGWSPQAGMEQAVGPEVERLWQPVPKAHRAAAGAPTAQPRSRCANGATYTSLGQRPRSLVCMPSRAESPPYPCRLTVVESMLARRRE